MIRIDRNKHICHIEGEFIDLMNEWGALTACLYSTAAAQIGLKKASSLFSDSLVEACTMAAEDLEEE